MEELSYSEYPLKIFKLKKQLFLQSLDFTYNEMRKEQHRTEVYSFPLTTKQKDFCIQLLQIEGVLRLTIYCNQIVIWKCSGWDWDIIDDDIKDVFEHCQLSDIDLEEQKVLLSCAKHRLYEPRFYRSYLVLSVAIFQAKYEHVRGYRHHLAWNNFLTILRQAGVERAVIHCNNPYDDGRKEYTCTPMTHNSLREAYLEERYVIEEIIEL